MTLWHTPKKPKNFRHHFKPHIQDNQDWYSSYGIWNKETSNTQLILMLNKGFWNLAIVLSLSRARNQFGQDLRMANKTLPEEKKV